MRNLTNFYPNTTLKYLKNLQFNGLLLTNVYNVWAKKVQSSYVWWPSRLIKGLKENWLALPKMTKEIWQLFTRALESLKIETLMASFLSKVENIWAYDNEELCKIWRGIDLRSLTNFDLSPQKSQKFALICTLMGCFWLKYML